MVQDALREMEEKGTSPEESWMVGLKEAAGSAFLGRLLDTLTNFRLMPMHAIQLISCIRDGTYHTVHNKS